MTLTIARPSAPSTRRPARPAFQAPRYATPEPRLANGKPYPSAGDVVGDWIETWLVNGEGDHLGEAVKLEPFQRYILRRLYTYDPATGQLLYDRAIVGMAKGNGKSQLFADIGLAELVGPIAPIAPNIPVSAASWDQANRLLYAARLAIEGDGDAQRGPLAEFFVDGEHLLEDKILHPTRVGSLYRIAAVGGTNDGGLPTIHLGDELHEWLGERRRRVYVVQGRSLRKRQVPRPLTPEVAALLPMYVAMLYGAIQIGISTSGADLDTLLGDLYLHGIKVAAGEVDDPSFLFLWWEAQEKWDPDEREQLRQAILEANPAAGGFLLVSSVESSFRDPTVARHEGERYNLNRWSTAPDRWMSRDAWTAARHPEGLVEPPDGVEITLGFDGSDVDDSTAIIGCTVEERPHLFVVEVWEKDLHDPNWTVPRSEVDERLELTFARWKVKRLAADESRWQHDVERWATAYGRDIVIRIPQSHERMAPAADRLRAAVLHRDPETEDPAPLVTHDGHPTLARHIGNAHTRPTKWGLAIKKDRPESARKIDGAVAAALAHDEAIRPSRRTRRRSTFRSM